MSTLPAAARTQVHRSPIQSWDRTPAFPLERLPLLALEAVCECLATTNRDICAFSLTCVCFAAVSRRHRLQHIRLRGTQELRRDLSRLEQTLRPNPGSRFDGHVRCMTLTNATTGPPLPETHNNASGGDDAEMKKPRLPEPKIIFEGPPNFCSTPRGQTAYDPFYASTLEEKAEYNELWLPVARFIGTLPRLADLIFDCNYEVPTCLLHALHERGQTTRLHVNHFSLRSLYQPINVAQHAISADEYMLATSPCLSSIALKWFKFDYNGSIGFNKEAVMQMVSGFAPNLKSVAIESYYPGDGVHIRNARAIPEHKLPKWKGLGGNGLEPVAPRKGYLHTLACSSDEIEAWAEATHFEELRSLKVDYLSPKSIWSLTRIAICNGFPSLRSISLNLVVVHTDVMEDMDKATSSLIGALMPLKTLLLRGVVGENTFQAVVDRHGATLRQLQLLPLYSYGFDALPLTLLPHHIWQLQSHCPNLEKLEILVPRTEGNCQEATMYQTLGKFPRLVSLILRLNCSCSEMREAGEAEYTRELSMVRDIPMSIFRRALINSAVDSRLGLSIFQAVTAEGRNNVRYMKLQLDNVGRFARGFKDCDVYAVVSWLARNWVCERDIEGGSVSVRQVAHDYIWEGYVDDDRLLKADFDGREDLREVWTSIWPGTVGDRRGQWAGIPLARELISL